jgi:tetratricopeptide (TPR) repeat protein
MPQTELDDAYQLFRVRRYAAAQELVDRVLAQDSDSGRAWELKGLLAWVSGERDLTEQALETAATLVPLLPTPAVALGDCYASAGRHELAVGWYEQSAEHPERSVGSLLAAAAGLDVLDLPYRSVRICRIAVQRDPEFAQSYFDLGYYLGRSGAPAHIVEAAARKAIQLAPQRMNYRVGLAAFLAQRHRMQDACDLVRQLPLDDLQQLNCTHCLTRLQFLYTLSQDQERAAACLDRCQQLRQRAAAGHSVGVDSCNG